MKEFLAIKEFERNHIPKASSEWLKLLIIVWLVEQHLIGSKVFGVCVVLPEICTVHRVDRLVPCYLVENGQVTCFKHLVIKEVLYGFQQSRLLLLTKLAFFFVIATYERRCPRAKQFLCGHSYIQSFLVFQARQLILLEVWHKTALVLTKRDFGEEFAHA